MELSMRPLRTARVLAGLILLFMAAHIATQYARIELGRENLRGLVRLFDLDANGNIPSFYSAVTFLFAAACLYAIGVHAARTSAAYVRHWKALAILFVLVAIEEAAGVHHSFNLRVPEVDRRAWGPFYFTWTITYAVVVLLIAVVFLKFVVAHLPQLTRYLFVIAALLYVSGALGMEMIAGMYVAEGGRRPFVLSTMAAIEEFMEMAGVVVFIYGLMHYMSLRGIGIGVVIERDPSPAPLLEPEPASTPLPQRA